MISVIFDVDRIGGPDPASFEASVDAYQIGNLVITDSMQGEQAYSLSPRRNRATGIDLIQVGLYRSGGYRGDANGTSIKGKPGDLQILDLARPMHSVELASAMVCVFLPRELLQERIGDLDDVHGLDLRFGMGPLLADYLGLLAKRLPEMAEGEGEAAANATLEIIVACLRPTLTNMGAAQSSIQEVMLLRAKGMIEENLRLARLTPDFLIQRLGISRRSLYRLFEPLGGVHHYILRRRLGRIKRARQAPDNRERIADVAARFGFTCQETFWRAFKRQYGVSPGGLRSLGHEHATNERRHVEVGFDQLLKRL